MESFEVRTYQFVRAMVLACGGNQQAQQLTTQLIGQMMQDAEMQPLCKSLMQIVAGERDQAILTTGLEGEARSLIVRILEALPA